MIFTIIIYSHDHGYNSYVEFQLGLQNSINISVKLFKAVISLLRYTLQKNSQEQAYSDGVFCIFYLSRVVLL